MLVIKRRLILFFFLIFTYSASAETSQTLQLDKLFNTLGKINNIQEANLLEKKIWAIWNKHPRNKKLTDKLQFGTELMYERNYKFALEVFNNVIKNDPSWSEAWNKRATLLYIMKDYERSLIDIKNVLNIEPRHFGALSGRAQIFIELKEYQKAINDLKKANKIHPGINSTDLIKKLEKLAKGLNI